MTKRERFIDVLRTFDTPVTVAEWANSVIEQYPSLLTQINSKTNEKMTLKDLAMTISLKVSKEEFSEIKIFNNGSYRKVMYMTESMKNELTKKEVQQDLESIALEFKRKEDLSKSTESDRYRLEELNSIKDQLNRYFSLNFVFHYASALINKNNKSRHHIDNLQLLTEEHSVTKKDGENKFSIDEQKAYIKKIISIQMMINKSIDVNLTDEVLEMLLERLEKIY